MYKCLISFLVVCVINRFLWWLRDQCRTEFDSVAARCVIRHVCADEKTTTHFPFSPRQSSQSHVQFCIRCFVNLRDTTGPSESRLLSAIAEFGGIDLSITAAICNAGNQFSSTTVPPGFRRGKSASREEGVKSTSFSGPTCSNPSSA